MYVHAVERRGDSGGDSRRYSVLFGVIRGYSLLFAAELHRGAVAGTPPKPHESEKKKLPRVKTVWPGLT